MISKLWKGDCMANDDIETLFPDVHRKGVKACTDGWEHDEVGCVCCVPLDRPIVQLVISRLLVVLVGKRSSKIGIIAEKAGVVDKMDHGSMDELAVQRVKRERTQHQDVDISGASSASPNLACNHEKKKHTPHNTKETNAHLDTHARSSLSSLWPTRAMPA